MKKKNQLNWDSKSSCQFYQFPMKIIPVGLCLKALNSIENVLHPSETNRIENYECFQVVGFGKKYKNEKNVCKWPPEKPWKWKYAWKWGSNSQISVKSLSMLKKSAPHERLIQFWTFIPKSLLVLGVEKFPKTAWQKKSKWLPYFTWFWT